MAVFGNIGIDSGNDTTLNVITGRLYGLLLYGGLTCSQSGTVTALYIKTGTLTTANNLRLALYEAAGNSLIADTGSIAATSDAIVGGSVAPVAVTAGLAYYMAVQFDGSVSAMPAVNGHDLAFGSQAYGAFPGSNPSFGTYDTTKWMLSWAEGAAGGGGAGVSANLTSQTLMSMNRGFR